MSFSNYEILALTCLFRDGFEDNAAVDDLVTHENMKKISILIKGLDDVLTRQSRESAFFNL